MSRPMEYPHEGDRPSAQWGRDVTDTLRALTPRSSPSCRVSMTAAGVTLRPVSRPVIPPAFPWKLLAFGYRKSGSVVTIYPGRIFAAETVILVAEVDVTLTGGPTEYIYAEFILGGSGGTIGHSTSVPSPAANTIRFPLYSFARTASGYRLAGIHHMGDIILYAPLPGGLDS